jgi:glycosyltransferase involved in cell wall biosynthesis
MRQRSKVCLIAPGYLASTPRVVREANALAEAGFDVRVVFAQGPLQALREVDAGIAGRASWRADAFRFSTEGLQERIARLRVGLRHRAARALAPRGLFLPGVAERAEGRVYPELARLASRERADLYIGHYPSGLAAAAAAARRHGALVGYDIEDLYAETFPPSDHWRPTREAIMAIERRHLPLCRHLTAVSEPIAAEFVRRYQTAPPVLVHNAHPWADRHHMDGLRRERLENRNLSLFWFSQTVGLDRGLQTAMLAASLVSGPVDIHIRGSLASDVGRDLRAFAEAHGVGDHVHFHPTCPPGELLSRAAEHDVGLALETSDALNHRLTVSNKILLYLTAGLAIAATDLPGQRGVLQTCPDAGALHAPGDARTLAHQLEAWSRNPARLAAAKAAALEAARTRWNAETEGRTLVAAIQRLLPDADHKPAA